MEAKDSFGIFMSDEKGAETVNMDLSYLPEIYILKQKSTVNRKMFKIVKEIKKEEKLDANRDVRAGRGRRTPNNLTC